MTAFGQEKIYVEERPIMMGKQHVNAFLVKVHHNPKTLNKSFTRYAKETLKVKMKRGGKGQLVAEKVDNPTVSSKKGDLRTLVYKEGNVVKLAVAFIIGYDLALESSAYPEEAIKFKEFVRRYGIYHESNYFKEILSDNQKRLNELTKRLKNNQKEVKRIAKRMKKIDRSLIKEKDENKRFDLTNQNVENQSKLQATNNVISNLKIEIIKFDNAINTAKGSLQKLGSQAYE